MSLTTISRATAVAVGIALCAAGGLAGPAGPATADAQAAAGHRHTFHCRGTVTRVHDGDTLYVRLHTGCPGGRKGHVIAIRNAAIQATEIAKRGHHAECWGPTARKFFTVLMPKGSQVRLSSYHATVSNEEDGRGRTRYIKYVDVKTASGHWLDVQRAEIEAGLALWKAEPHEPARVVPYMRAEQDAIVQHRGIWGDPTHCSSRYAPGARLHAWTVWKTNGPDRRGNANQEAFKVRNVGRSTVNLSHWKVRDPSHKFYRGRSTYLTLPAGTRLAPGKTLTIHPGRGRDRPHRSVFYDGYPHLPYFPNAPMGAHPGNPSGYGTHPTRGVPGRGIYLLDPALDFRAWSVYPCIESCGTPPPLAIVKVHYRRKAHQSVVIKNVGGRRAPLTGIVFDADGHTRTLDTGRHLDPGHRMVLHVQGHRHDSATDEYWGQRRHLLNLSGETVWLRTAADVTIDIYRWGNHGHYRY